MSDAYPPDMNLKEIDWVTVGGESGRKPRSIDEDWVLDILDQCKAADVEFFFKQSEVQIRSKREEFCWKEHGMRYPFCNKRTSF